ncbi:MAG: hypothetical protein QXU40_03030 [Candidatus Pacearchaeota archaeon]
MRSDYTVIVTGLVDPFGFIYIVDMFRKVIDGRQLPFFFFKLYRQWQWMNVGIDANANQITMKWLIEAWVGRPWNELYPGSNDTTKISAPMITELENGGQNKYSLIESICGGNWDRIRFSKKISNFDDIKTEFRELRRSKHDDIPDAFANLIRVVRVPPMIDLGMVDPRTGIISKYHQKKTVIDYLAEMDEFDRLMVQ